MLAHPDIREGIARPGLESRRDGARFVPGERRIAELRAQGQVSVVREAACNLYKTQALDRHIVPAADARGGARVEERPVAVAGESPLRRPRVHRVVGVDGVEVELSGDVAGEGERTHRARGGG